MAVKKKRTEKQIAATKKLVRLNKARAAAKKKTAKKKAARKSNPKTRRFYVAFVPVGEKKYYYHGFDSKKKRAVFDDDIEGALWYRTSGQAIAEVEYIGKKSGALHPRKHKVFAEPYSPK